ncbi:MAG: inorganic phosphate transporter [Prevotella sp.]|nr:inorganic phosphate transporter [Prevotella sp.]
MDTIYLCIVIFLLCLAVFDLFVGVSNDAVNFLQSAVGARVAKFRTIIIIASVGVAVGAVLSTGMMDLARHGIAKPDYYTFNQMMIIFLAVMVTDVIILDMFNSLGLPTSTTVSLVFELLGATFVMALIKMAGDGSLTYADLMNSDKALNVIIAIFVSVAIAFVFGVLVQWLTRLVFTFNYKKRLAYAGAIFSGIAFTALSYFIFVKGVGKSPYLAEESRQWINDHTGMLMLGILVVSTIVMEVLHLLKVNIFKIIVLMGTFALAMAFSGNDLVNFIGIPLAGLDSYTDYMANGAGNYDGYLMHSLMESAKTPPIYLMAAGVVMIVAMATSKKAHNVIKTSVDLSRQDEGDQMFGSSKAARSIVRATQDFGTSLSRFVPAPVAAWVNSRFNQAEKTMEEGAAYDIIRAAINLVLASILIVIGTNYKLPLSTTYVTFMVAMGTSLADRAWSRESAVFRVTGVLSVIGGWFITAGAAFVAAGLVCLAMYFGGFVAMVGFMILVVFMLIKGSGAVGKKKTEDANENAYRLMMRTEDPMIVWDLLQKHVSKTQSFTTHFVLEQYNKIIMGFANEKVKHLRKSVIELKEERNTLRKYRKQELLVLKKAPRDLAIESNTWFHVAINSCEQYMYCLLRVVEPIKEHVENNFNPLPKALMEEFEPVRLRINELMLTTEKYISEREFSRYREILLQADECKDELSVLRKRHIDRLHDEIDSSEYQVSLLYLNILQESQELLSIMRRQLRATKKFME